MINRITKGIVLNMNIQRTSVYVVLYSHRHYMYKIRDFVGVNAFWIHFFGYNIEGKTKHPFASSPYRLKTFLRYYDRAENKLRGIATDVWNIQTAVVLYK